jgi:hypothetical protein
MYTFEYCAPASRIATLCLASIIRCPADDPLTRVGVMIFSIAVGAVDNNDDSVAECDDDDADANNDDNTDGLAAPFPSPTTPLQLLPTVVEGVALCLTSSSLLDDIVVVDVIAAINCLTLRHTNTNQSTCWMLINLNLKVCATDLDLICKANPSNSFKLAIRWQH